MYGGYRIKKTFSTFLRSSWERVCVNMIIYGDLDVDLYYVCYKTIFVSVGSPNPNYMLLFNVLEGIGSKKVKHLLLKSSR